MPNTDEEIKTIAFALFREISKLSLILEQCKQLYSNKETVSMLNEVSGVFFELVQSQFSDSLISGICRLTDPIKTCGKENLSINNLKNRIQDKNLEVELNELCCKANELSMFAKNHRNERISHLDFNIHTGNAASTFDSVTFAKLESSLQAISDVIQFVFKHKFATCIDNRFINLQGSANALIGQLKLLKSKT